MSDSTAIRSRYVDALVQRHQAASLAEKMYWHMRCLTLLAELLTATTTEQS